MHGLMTSDGRSGLGVRQRQRLTLLAVCISQGMIVLDVTIVNIALPSIQRNLHTSPGALELVVSAYALSLAALIPISGTVGDHYGRKRLFVIGMVVFTLGSIACALSASANALICARAVQGIGGAVMSALGLSILTETYPVTKRAGAIATWAAVAGLGFGLGPIVGGILLGTFGWSSIFWVNVPFALAGLTLTVTVVREARDPPPHRLDIVGALLSAMALIQITFGLIESASHDWNSWPVGVPLAIGATSLLVFVIWERRAPWPMVPAALRESRSYASSCAVYVFCYVALTGVLFFLTLLYQNVDRWSALHTGLSWLAMDIPFLAVAQLTGRLSGRVPSAVAVGGGCIVSAIGILSLSTLTASSSFLVAGVGLALLGVGNGMLIPEATNAAMRDVPAGSSGAASGILNASRQVGTSIGLAVLGTIGAKSAASAWGHKIATLPAAAHTAAFRQTQNVTGARITAITQVLGATLRAAAVQSFDHGYRIALTVAGIGLLVAAAVATTGLRRPHRGELERESPAVAALHRNESRDH